MGSSLEEQRTYLEKLLAEKSAIPVPSVRDLHGSLLFSLDVAEELAHNRPEYAAAVTSFTRIIRRIKKELMSSFELGSIERIEPILGELSTAKVIALLLEEGHPEKRDFLTKFQVDLGHAWDELTRKVGPDVKPQA